MDRISHDRLKEALHYDPETGHFTRLKSAYPACVGKRVGSPLQGRNGQPAYLVVSVDRVRYAAHQIAWFYMTGEWPIDLIDHKDRDGLNNRWINLRLADSSKNQQNNKRRADNKSGFKGVTFHEEGKKWRAMIKANGRRIHLGLFTSPEIAHAAYVAAAQKYFGEFARAA